MIDVALLRANLSIFKDDAPVHVQTAEGGRVLLRIVLTGIGTAPDGGPVLIGDLDEAQPEVSPA